MWWVERTIRLHYNILGPRNIDVWNLVIIYHHLLTLHGSTDIHCTSTPVIFVYFRVVDDHSKFGPKLLNHGSLHTWPCVYLVPINRRCELPAFSSVAYHKYWALTHPRPRSSVIHFACIGVAPSQMFMPRHAQSTGATPMQANGSNLIYPRPNPHSQCVSISMTSGGERLLLSFLFKKKVTCMFREGNLYLLTLVHNYYHF